MATLPTLAASGALPKSGPFPPPALPGFVGTTSLSATPRGPACPSRASGWEARPPTAGVSRVAWLLLMQTCRRHYPGGNAGGAGVVPPDILASAAFPIPLLGRLPHFPFRGLLGVHACYGLSARGVAETTLCIEGFDSIVTSTAAPIATGWNDQLPGGNCTH
jgi:hypothetical protein